MKKNSLLFSLITENISVKELPRALRINEAFYYTQDEDMSKIFTFLTNIVPVNSSTENISNTYGHIANKYDVNDEKEKNRLAIQTKLSLQIDLPILTNLLSGKKI